MEIRNYLEDIVKRIADELMNKDRDFCNCSQCRSDVFTFSLNHLKPKYADTVKGHALTAVDIESEQVQAEVTVQVLEAIKKVKEQPNHPS
jgi:competence protein ComFB